ncbi:MAG: LCP family protein [Candidatus Caldarchaeum sp.]
MKRTFGWILYSFFCLLALGIGSFLGFASRYPLMAEFFIGGLRSAVGLKPNSPFVGESDLFVLVIGCDVDRDRKGRIINKYARADTIHFIRFDFAHEGIGILHIPRDLVVEPPGYSPQRINAMLVSHGTRGVAGAVHWLTGIYPDRVVVFSFDDVEEIVDTVGGVEVFVPKKMKYTDRRGDLHIDLLPGRQRLDGKKAVGFLRYRLDSDLYRGQRQQEFLLALRDEVNKKPVTLPQLSEVLHRILADSFSASEIRYLVLFSQSLSSSRIKHGQFPTKDGPDYTLLPVLQEVEAALIQSGIKDPASSVTAGGGIE